MTGMVVERRSTNHAAPPMVDGAAPVLPPGATLRQVLDVMAAEDRRAICIVDSRGVYLGACTLRGIAGTCLGVSEVAAAAIPSFAFRHDDMTAARRRLAPRLNAAAVDNLDPRVPSLTMPLAMSDVLRHLHLGAPLVAIVAAGTGGFLGTIEARAVLSALIA